MFLLVMNCNTITCFSRT